MGGLLCLQVAQTVSEIFAEMIFIFGDVHCDPHEVRHSTPRLALRPKP